MLSFQSNTIKPINMKIGMYKYFLWRTFLYYPLYCRSPTGGAAAYPLLHRSTYHLERWHVYVYFGRIRFRNSLCCDSPRRCSSITIRSVEVEEKTGTSTRKYSNTLNVTGPFGKLCRAICSTHTTYNAFIHFIPLIFHRVMHTLVQIPQLLTLILIADEANL